MTATVLGLVGGSCVGLLVGIFAALLVLDNKLHRIAVALEERRTP